MRWTGHEARVGERRGAYRVSVGKPEGRRLKRRGEDNIKMNIQEVGWEGMYWIDLAEDRDRWWAYVNVVMDLCGP